LWGLTWAFPRLSFVVIPVPPPFPLLLTVRVRSLLRNFHGACQPRGRGGRGRILCRGCRRRRRGCWGSSSSVTWQRGLGVGRWDPGCRYRGCWGSSTLVTWRWASDVARCGRWEPGARRRACWRSSTSVTWQPDPVRFGGQEARGGGDGRGYSPWLHGMGACRCCWRRRRCWSMGGGGGGESW
jgi:hypothetical protein